MSLSFGADRSFFRELTPEEVTLARGLIRRNLLLKHTSLFEGVVALFDLEAVPILKKMLADETNLSWRLTISSTLWKLVKDPVFVECLQQAKATRPSIFGYQHLDQVLWLNDERAIDFLIDLVDLPEWRGQGMVLGLLNQLEFSQFGKPIAMPPGKLPHQVADYRKLRGNSEFRARMLSALHKWNADSIYGRRWVD